MRVQMLVLLVLLGVCAAGEADPKVLPASTTNAVKAYDAELAKAKAEYDKRDEAAKKVLIAALKKAQEAEMKANNPEGALAIKKRIEELMSKASSLLSNTDTAFLYNKKWKTDWNVTVTINEDGTFTDSGDWKPAKWTMNGDVITLEYTNGNTRTCTIDKKGGIFKSN